MLTMSFLFFLSPGDVVLKNLVLKRSALNELDLPVQATYGHLGNLVLKIPWKNLYSAPVEAIIDRLYLLAVPNSSVRYNAEREDKAELDAKKGELDRIQLAKKLELEKSKNFYDVLSLFALTKSHLFNRQAEGRQDVR